MLKDQAAGREDDLNHCIFCKKTENDVLRLLKGPDVYVCNFCIASIAGWICETLHEEPYSQEDGRPAEQKPSSS